MVWYQWHGTSTITFGLWSQKDVTHWVRWTWLLGQAKCKCLRRTLTLMRWSQPNVPLLLGSRNFSFVRCCQVGPHLMRQVSILCSLCRPSALLGHGSELTTPFMCLSLVVVSSWSGNEEFVNVRRMCSYWSSSSCTAVCHPAAGPRRLRWSGALSLICQQLLLAQQILKPMRLPFARRLIPARSTSERNGLWMQSPRYLAERLTSEVMIACHGLLQPSPFFAWSDLFPSSSLTLGCFRV